MKSKDLIAKILELDPTGEVECCIGNSDIYHIDILPAYWDGRLQVLEYDESKKPYYSVKGGRYQSSGNKIDIAPLPFSDALRNDEKFEIDYSQLGASPEEIERYKKSDDNIRKSSKRLESDLTHEAFIKWGKRLAESFNLHTEDLETNLTTFYANNQDYLDYNNGPYSSIFHKHHHCNENGKGWYRSINDARDLFYNDVVKIDFNGWDWQILKVIT
jgi:hypothetical protein